jgi:undecaprenyl phosphate-alpha-L-ara4N flippase subunit ArnF
MWTSYLILAAITGLTLFGDYAIKIATSKDGGLMSSWFVLGAILYGLPAIGWFYLMKSHSLAMIGVMYSASTIVLLAALGYFVFKEAFGWREVVGLSLAIAAVFVMSHE